jgi:hypothetical protein
VYVWIGEGFACVRVGTARYLVKGEEQVHNFAFALGVLDYRGVLIWASTFEVSCVPESDSPIFV